MQQGSRDALLAAPTQLMWVNADRLRLDESGSSHTSAGFVLYDLRKERSMKHILVAVDGSEHSTKAVDAAAIIASAVGAKLSLVAVLPSLAEMADELEPYARAENLLNELPRLLGSMQPAFLEPAAARARAKRVSEVALETTTGNPATEILAMARDKSVDLIVVGSRGRGRLSGLLLGSVSQKVAAHAPCSVMIVR